MTVSQAAFNKNAGETRRFVKSDIILFIVPSDIFNAAKFVASKKGYLPYALIVEPGKTEITVVLKKDPDQKAGKKEKGKKKK